MPACRAPRDAEVFDSIAERRRVFEIFDADAADAFRVNGVRIEPDAECERRQNGELVRGVDAFDVERRIGLGIPERLCVGERLRKVVTRRHLREDVVRRAVDDSGNPVDRVAGESFAQRLDDRNAAGDRAFEADADRRPARAAGNSRAPRIAISALLAVTKCLPCVDALLEQRGRPRRRRRSSRRPHRRADPRRRRRSSVENGTPRGNDRRFRRAARDPHDFDRPAGLTCDRRRRLHASNDNTPWPTVPMPHRPIRSGCTVDIPESKRRDRES